MALREIRTLGDPILEKSCREVTEMTPRLEELIQDMLDTMYDAEGVGLAAPQVGVRRRIVVIDVGEGPIILINPVITESDGEQTGAEGCLSVPGQAGTVTRPNHVIVKALNEKMEEIEVEGTELLARALCHELDHLDGIMYVTKVEGELYDTASEEETEEEAGEPGEETASQEASAEEAGKEEQADENRE
ncbi:MAG: peptide deformylase [Lachnospiraceae bacterium]|nr:peptide deformylase [Lachnospiraceae bacterium]